MRLKTDYSDYILTPPEKPEPQINGPRVFGVRPGAPFLFQVAATGKKPLKYSAEDLPGGLKIDQETGSITGKITEAKDYTVLLQVENERGQAERELLIKVGDSICLTPPMGWNSWYCWSESVSDQKIRDTARAMKEKGLVAHGWTYVNIDDCWQGLRGGDYKAIMGNERFPDMKGLADYVHSQGLKIGIYSTPWIGSYAGFIGGTADNPEGDYSNLAIPEDERPQPCQIFGRSPNTRKLGMRRFGDYWFTDEDAKQWADWGIDYVKYDWNPNDVPTTKKLAEGLKKCGRDIVLSLSNSAPFKNAEKLSKIANLWRTTGDIRDIWLSISHIGFGQEKWREFARPGHWNDPDMLQVGQIGVTNTFVRKLKDTHLTPDEQYTQISLWCLLSAPLLLSCDIESLDDFTISLLTNDEVLEIDQDPLGIPAERAFHKFGREIWIKKLHDGDIAVGMFNRWRFKRRIKLVFDKYGLEDSYDVRDLWRQKELGSFEDVFSAQVPSHGVKLVKLHH